MNKKDIKTRDAIEKLIRSFYKKVIDDKTLGIIFTEIVPLKLRSSYYFDNRFLGNYFIA